MSRSQHLRLKSPRHLGFHLADLESSARPALAPARECALAQPIRPICAEGYGVAMPTLIPAVLPLRSPPLLGDAQ